jgi:hypothetical protein
MKHIGLFDVCSYWIFPAKSLQHRLAVLSRRIVVYGTVIVFPDTVLGTDGADGGVGGVIPMLAKGAALVGADVDG